MRRSIARLRQGYAAANAGRIRRGGTAILIAGGSLSTGVVRSTTTLGVWGSWGWGSGWCGIVVGWGVLPRSREAATPASTPQAGAAAGARGSKRREAKRAPECAPGLRAGAGVQAGMRLDIGDNAVPGESCRPFSDARSSGGRGGAAPAPCFAGALTREAGAPQQSQRARPPCLGGEGARGGVQDRERSEHHGGRSPCGARDAGRSPTPAPQSRTDAHARERVARRVCGRPWGAFGGIGGAAEWHPATRRAAARGPAWGQGGARRATTTKGPKPRTRRKGRRAVAPQEGFPPCRIPFFEGGTPGGGGAGGETWRGETALPGPPAACGGSRVAATVGGEAVGRTPLKRSAGAAIGLSKQSA